MDFLDFEQTRATSEAIKVVLVAGAIGLVWAWRRLSPTLATRLLVVLVLASGINYMRYSPNVFLKQLDAYDLVHYYLGAKYFDELGYFDLYPAMLLVDVEHGPYNRKSRFYRAQDKEHGYRERTPLSHAHQRGREVRDKHFTPERWRAFEHDFLVIQRNHGLGAGLWNTLINDRGFNGTPVWLMFARPIANAFPVEWIKALCWLDVALLTLALLALAWAYGRNTALFALLFLFLTYSLRWPYVTWAFLRYDWVSCLLIAMALLKKGKFPFAGVLTGYAALVRLFPAAWMFGPFMQGVFGLFDGKKPFKERINKKLVLFATGFVLCVGLLEGAAIGIFGMDAVRTHAHNITEHIKPEELSSRRVGFALAYSYHGKQTPKNLAPERKIQIKHESGSRTFLAALLLIALGYAARKKRPDESFALGAIPFFMLSTASYYYYVCRITLIAWHASDLDKHRNRVGLTILLGIELFTNLVQSSMPGYRVFLIGYMSWALLGYCIWLTFALLGESRGAPDDDETN